MPSFDPSIRSQLNSLAHLDNSETIHVWSPSPWQICKKDTRYSGKTLDRAGHAYFKSYYPYIDLEALSDLQAELFVTARFQLGPNLVGYLLRVPGMYSSTVVDLWTYDQKAGTWLKPVAVAESWGDADDWYELQSWLVDINGDGYHDIIKRAKGGFIEGVGKNPDLLAVQLLKNSEFAGPEVLRDPKFRKMYDFDPLESMCE